MVLKKKKKKTGAVFIDLTTAYNAVNHNLLMDKVYKITKDYHLTKAMESMSINRRFHVRLQNQKANEEILKMASHKVVSSRQYFLMYTQITSS